MTPVNYEATNWASLISQIRLMQLPSNSEPPLNTQVPGPMPGPSRSEQHHGEHVLQHRADEQQLEQSILRQHSGDDNNVQLNSTLSHCQALVCHSRILHNIIRFCTRHAPNANGHQRVVSSAGAQPVTSAERTSDQLATMMHQPQAIAHPPAQPTQQQPVAQPIQNSRQPAPVILQPPGYIYNVTGLYKQIRYIDWLRSIMFTESQSWHRLTSFSFEFSSSNDPSTYQTLHLLPRLSNNPHRPLNCIKCKGPRQHAANARVQEPEGGRTRSTVGNKATLHVASFTTARPHVVVANATIRMASQIEAELNSRSPLLQPTLAWTSRPCCA